MKYYIIYPNRKVEFASYTQLVNYLLKPRPRTYGSRKYDNNNDPLKDRVQITGKDTCRAVVDFHYNYFPSLGRYPIPEYGYILRDIKIVDEYNNNVFNHQLIDDLKKYEFREDIEREHQLYINLDKKPNYSRFCNIPDYKFRSDPVPYTGHRNYRSCWRHPRTTQEKRKSCDLEYKNFYRKSRGKNLPSVWDDLDRSSNCDISWKNCTKNRHQWENKIKCRNKHMYVYKLVEVFEDCDLN